MAKFENKMMSLGQLRTLIREIETSWTYINSNPTVKDAYKRKVQEYFPDLMYTIQIRNPLPNEKELSIPDARRELIFYSVQMCNRYLNFFDTIITRMTIYYAGLSQVISQELHQFIVKNCSRNLKEIHFIGLKIALMEGLATFPRVETLFIQDSDLGFRLASFAYFFPNVRRLHMVNVRLEIFYAHFEHLEYFQIKLNSFEMGYGIRNATDLWHDNRNLRILDVDMIGATGMPLGDLLNTINTKSLSNLSIKTEIVTVNVTRREVAELIEKLPGLRRLHLISYRFSMDDVIYLINRLTWLQYFAYQVTSGDLWNAEYIEELEREVGHDWHVNDGDFVEIIRNL